MARSYFDLATECTAEQLDEDKPQVGTGSCIDNEDALTAGAQRELS